MMQKGGRSCLRFDSGRDSDGGDSGGIADLMDSPGDCGDGAADFLFCDGGFAISPRSFQQLYFFRAIVGVSSVTGAYCLLPRKTRAAYEALPRKLVRIFEKIGVGSASDQINLDSESETMQAIHTAWGTGTNVTTCYYHLGQSIWRRAQEEGLQGARRG